MKRAEYCFSSRMGKTNPSVFGGWAVPNPGKTGSGLGRGGTGLACSETGGARSGGKAAGTLRWRCPRRRARQGTQCAPAPRQTNPSYSSVPAFGTMRSPFYSVPVPGAAYAHVKMLPSRCRKGACVAVIPNCAGGYSSAISRATKTPLAEAWDREWVTPLPSPITYSPG